MSQLSRRRGLFAWQTKIRLFCMIDRKKTKRKLKYKLLPRSAGVFSVLFRPLVSHACEEQGKIEKILSKIHRTSLLILMNRELVCLREVWFGNNGREPWISYGWPLKRGRPEWNAWLMYERDSDYYISSLPWWDRKRCVKSVKKTNRASHWM